LDQKLGRAAAHGVIKLIVAAEAQALAFGDVRQRLVLVVQLGFTKPQQAPAGADPRRQLDSFAQGVGSFGIAMQLVEGGAQGEPAFRPRRLQGQRLFEEVRGLLRAAVEHRLGAPRQVLELFARRALRTQRGQGER